MKTNRFKKVDVVILSGFLGSGKSTLLKQLIQETNYQGKQGVIINELGNVGIDSAVVNNKIPTREILDGCICCTSQGRLSEQMHILLDQHDLDIIYVEATGVAHPLEVVDAITHPMIAARIRIKSIMTMVNAKQWNDGSDNHKIKKLIQSQVRAADIVFINKKDLLSKEETQTVERTVTALNKRAITYTVSFANIEFFNHHHMQNKRYETRSGQKQDVETHVHDHLHVNTVTIPLKKPVNRIKLAAWLRDNHSSIHRAKGFLFLDEAPGLYLFDYAYKEPIIQRTTSGNDQHPVLVCIGEKLDATKIKQEWGVF